MSKDLKIGINPILNLNKHPRECENLSLINANNVKLSNDLSCLESENSIISNQVINDYLMRLYSRYNIINIIPCNKELILFVGKASETTAVISEGYDITIVRYNEDKNKCIKYTDYKYYGGKINGTFTYNVNGELILAIAEYDGVKKVPLKTINLGLFEEKDVEINNKILPLNPEVIIPRIKDYDYVDGNLYKGWYYIYLRYKIGDNDYTRWFSISNKILVNTLDKYNIIKYYKSKNDKLDVNDFYLSGVYDYFSNEKEIANESIKITLDSLDNNYKEYQLGVIIISNTYNKCYITDDLSISNINHTFDLSLMNEYSEEEMIKSPINFFNVKNVINYKNKIYISNYEELNINNYDTDKIDIKLEGERISLYDIKQNNYINDSSIGESYEISSIAKKKTEIDENDTIEAKIIKDLNINGTYPNNDLTQDLIFNDEPLDNAKELGIHLHDYDYTSENIINNGNVIKITKLDLKRKFIIQSANGNLVEVNVIAKSDFVPLYTDYPYVNVIFEVKIGEEKYQSYGGSYFTTADNNNKILYLGTQVKGSIDDKILKSALESNKSLLYYVDTKESYDFRKKKSTLIPGEVYNFYIHFVDKYGQVTKGYQIQNKNKLLSQDPDYIDTKYIESILIPLDGFVCGDDSDWEGCYLIRKFDDNVFNDTGSINIRSDEELFWCGFGDIITDIDNQDNSIVNEKYLIPGSNTEVIDFLNKKYKNLNNINNLKWYQIIDSTIGNQFIPYINKKGERLFKTPYYKIEVDLLFDDSYSYYNTLLYPKITNVDLPNEYEACFISYEKVQETNKISGVLTKYDCIKSGNESFGEYNKSASSYMRFYSSDFDLLDSVDLKYNALLLEKINCYDETLNITALDNINAESINNLNIPELESKNITKCIGITNYEIELANDYSKNRYGVGTCLKIPIINELFETGENTIYKASLLYIDESIYSNDDKVLIKCSDLIYKYNVGINFNFNLNGYITYNNFLIYNANKVVFNETKRVVYDKDEKSYSNDVKYLTYIQSPVYKSFMYETKCFNNNPKNLIYDIKTLDTDDKITKSGCFVDPANSLDLFRMKYNLGDQLVPKFYINYKEDIHHLNEFNKFIRRSQVIKDESLENSWRIFEAEDYKIISENKGNITNILGLGIYLIVHTEHSIFIFSSDNTLKNGDATIQLENSDIFDLDYKELISSELGYGGLQDSDSWISGLYGYIYYDKDSNRLFRFDNNSLVNIDDNIINLLTEYKPKKIIFADDKESNRLLLNITFDDINKENNITLSYNYTTNSFISFHDYKFIDSINTKNKLYLIGKIDDYNSKIYNFDYYNKNNITHNSFSITDEKLHNNQLDIIINDTYDIVKFLENITYKLFKIKQNKENYNPTIINKSKIPYSGEKIRIYNDKVDTGWLDIKIQEGSEINPFMQYDKPYWYLGNWNFNYLRDKISIRDEANYMSKLYGNYFIVSIVFADSNDKIEFNSLMYNLTK